VKIIDAGNRRAIAKLTTPPGGIGRSVERRVRAIVDRVRTGGDPALMAFVRRFDGVTGPLEISQEDIRRQAARVDPDVRRALRLAARNIARVAFKQIPKHFDVQISPGVSVEQRVEPIARVGCYVPGGRFPLPSSLLMTAVPARVAGVPEIIVACPRPEPVVMAAALEAGVSRVFRMGGAHAIAAMAYGTAVVPRVDKIVGPGNRFVAAAKALVAPDCSIDFYAGPTEIVVVAGGGRASWIAADLIAQAEHDPDARSIFITWSRTLARRVAAQTAARARGRAVVEQSLATNGAVIVVRDSREAMALANIIAPEHLVVESEALVRGPVVAGSVFVGEATAQVAGDYAIGSNHVLPTAGAARFRGGLSAADFVRVMSVQRLTPRGLSALAPTVTCLAAAEGLAAHAESIAIRVNPPRAAASRKRRAR
jgi:histidinol dehydrogenase